MRLDFTALTENGLTDDSSPSFYQLPASVEA
jgi:hypothetical protein